MERKKGGRPRKEVNIKELMGLYQRLRSYRKAAEEYNSTRKGKAMISHELVRIALNREAGDDDA